MINDFRHEAVAVTGLSSSPRNVLKCIRKYDQNQGKKAHLLSLVMLVLLMGGTARAAEVRIPKQSDWIYHGIVLTNGPRGSWDVRLHGQISPCAILKKKGRYFLYYIGADGNRSTDSGPRHRALGVATSSDGINFTKYTKNPIITFLPKKNEEEGVFSCGAMVDENEEVVLYYGAMTATTPTSEEVNIDIRLAISRDGLEFIDHGEIISHSLPSVWGYGDEISPLGVLRSDGNWYVYYVSANGVETKWDLGLAWGPSRDNLPNTQAVLTSGSYIIGGGDPVWLGTDRIAVFIVRDFYKGIVEVRTAPSSSPHTLSPPIHTYDFGNFRHFTIFLDKEKKNWFMYYRHKKSNVIRLRVAPISATD